MKRQPKFIKYRGERYALVATRKRCGLLSDQDATKLVDIICDVGGKLCEEGYIVQDLDAIADEFEERGFEKVDPATVKKFLKTPGVMDWLTAQGAGAMRTSSRRKRLAFLPTYKLQDLIAWVKKELSTIKYDWEEDFVGDAVLSVVEYLSKDLSKAEIEEALDSLHTTVEYFEEDIRPELFKELGIETTEELKTKALESFEQFWTDTVQRQAEELWQYEQDARDAAEEDAWERRRERSLAVHLGAIPAFTIDPAFEKQRSHLTTAFKDVFEEATVLLEKTPFEDEDAVYHVLFDLVEYLNDAVDGIQKPKKPIFHLSSTSYTVVLHLCGGKGKYTKAFSLTYDGSWRMSVPGERPKTLNLATLVTATLGSLTCEFGKSTGTPVEQFIQELLSHGKPTPYDDEVLLFDGVLVQFDVMDDDSAHIHWLYSFAQKGGGGRKALELVTNLADKHCVTLTLQVGPFQFSSPFSRRMDLTDPKRIPFDKLTKFYESFGFELWGKDHMARDPSCQAVSRAAVLKKVATASNVPTVKLRQLYLKELRKYPDFAKAKKAYTIDIHRGMYWHVTSNPNFVIDSTTGPMDMSSMSGRPTPAVGKLMVTGDLESWSDYYGKSRPYAALIDMSQLIPHQDYHAVSRGFGTETWVDHPKKAVVLGVFPIKYAKVISKRFDIFIAQAEEELLQHWQEATGVNTAVQSHIARWNPNHFATSWTVPPKLAKWWTINQTDVLKSLENQQPVRKLCWHPRSGELLLGDLRAEHSQLVKRYGSHPLGEYVRGFVNDLTLLVQAWAPEDLDEEANWEAQYAFAGAILKPSGSSAVEHVRFQQVNGMYKEVDLLMKTPPRFLDVASTLFKRTGASKPAVPMSVVASYAKRIVAPPGFTIKRGKGAARPGLGNPVDSLTVRKDASTVWVMVQSPTIVIIANLSPYLVYGRLKKTDPTIEVSGHTCFRKKDAITKSSYWSSFDQIGISDSFYETNDEYPDPNAIIEGEIERVEKYLESYYSKTWLSVPELGYRITEEQKLNIEKLLKAGKGHVFHPSGMGTAYRITTRQGSRYDKRGSKALADFFDVPQIFIEQLDWD